MYDYDSLKTVDRLKFSLVYKKKCVENHEMFVSLLQRRSSCWPGHQSAGVKGHCLFLTPLSVTRHWPQHSESVWGRYKCQCAVWFTHLHQG